MSDDKKKITVKDPDDFLFEMREFNKEMTDGLDHIHKAGTDDLEMLLGENQWDKDIREWREKQENMRPCLTQNLLPGFTDQVKNDQRQSRPQVKAIPVDNDADPKTANVIAGLIRNIWYQSQAEAIHDGAFDSVVDCGLGAWRVLPEYESPMSFNQELRVYPIDNPFSVIWDLSCKKFDTSDKKKCLIHEVISKKEFKKRYPEAKVTASMDPQPEGTALAGWFMPEEEVRIAEYWYVEEREQKILELSNGQVIEDNETSWQKVKRRYGNGLKITRDRITRIPQIRSCIVSGAEILEGPFEIPGQYIPILIAFGKILNVKGKKHVKSLIRDAKESQRVHNYLISAMIEQYSLQPIVPFVGTQKQFEGHPEWGTANVGGHAYLPYTPDSEAPPPKRESPPQISNQLFPMIEGNKQHMRGTIGIYEAGLGMRSNEISGKAILARQKEGDTGTYVFLSNFLMVMQFEGRILVDLIPHYYDAPRSQMITGLEGEHTRVMLNQAYEENGKQLMYSIKTGKYDAMITTGPSFASQREETLQSMIDLIQPTMNTNPNAGSVLLLEIVKNINTVNADRLQKLIRATLAPELQAILEQDEAGGDENPEMQAIRQRLETEVQQKTGELQALVEELQARLQKAEGQEASRLAKIDLDREIGFKELALQADKIEKEIELMDRKYTAELLHKDRVAGTERQRQEEYESTGAPNVQVQPIVVPYKPKKGKRVVKITGPSGQVYSGEVADV